ncbi:MAG: M48 family metallopeptidase [Primorskyibacter sp.]
MIKLAPILLALIYGIVMVRFSAWRTARELDERSSELADPALRPVFDRLAQALDVKRIPVHLYEIEPVNGLAAPDGRVFLTRGFYNRYRQGHVTAEELASVVAHELGHVALGHSRRRMIDFSGQNALRTALGMILSRIIPGVGPWIANALTSLLAARMSRNDEYDAAALMTKAGLGIAPQKALFNKLDALAGGRGGTPAWFMSHPPTADRIQALEALEARWSVT